MAQPTLRIAILECDTPLPNTDAKYHGYAGVFSSLLSSALPTIRQTHPTLSLEISSYNVVSAQFYPRFEDIDAILITGSKHDSFADDSWIKRLVGFVEDVVEDGGVRIVGVCFGHQILGRALGAKVGRSEKGWEVSVTDVELTGKGKEIFGLEKLAINQMHRDVVFEYPEGVESLAFTEKCPVQGMYKPKKFITVQGHPEFNEEIVRELLKARHESGLFPDAMFEDAMARVGNSQDGVKVAEAFLRFLLE